MIEPPAVIGPYRVIGLEYITGLPLQVKLSDYPMLANYRTISRTTCKRCYRTNLFLRFIGYRACFSGWISYNTLEGKAMNYQTYLGQAANWMFSDVHNGMCVVIGIAVVGTVIGIYRSLNYCKFTGRCGRRVL